MPGLDGFGDRRDAGRTRGRAPRSVRARQRPYRRSVRPARSASAAATRAQPRAAASTAISSQFIAGLRPDGDHARSAPRRRTPRRGPGQRTTLPGVGVVADHLGTPAHALNRTVDDHLVATPHQPRRARSPAVRPRRVEARRSRTRWRTVFLDRPSTRAGSAFGAVRHVYSADRKPSATSSTETTAGPSDRSKLPPLPSRSPKVDESPAKPSSVAGTARTTTGHAVRPGASCGWASPR